MSHYILAPFAGISLTPTSKFNLSQLLQQFLEVERHAVQYLYQTEQSILLDSDFTENSNLLIFLRIPDTFATLFWVYHQFWRFFQDTDNIFPSFSSEIFYSFW
jgi:hypothetical protein